MSTSGVDIFHDLAARIVEERKQRFLTQSEAAIELGISERTLQAWEGGHAFPQPRHRRALNQWLNDNAPPALPLERADEASTYGG